MMTLPPLTSMPHQMLMRTLTTPPPPTPPPTLPMMTPQTLLTPSHLMIMITMMMAMISDSDWIHFAMSKQAYISDKSYKFNLPCYSFFMKVEEVKLFKFFLNPVSQLDQIFGVSSTTF